MIFVDSCTWNAAKNKRDANHQAACTILAHVAKGKYGKAVISDYIIDEVLTWLHAKVSHEAAVETARIFFETTRVEVKKVDWAILKEAHELFKKYEFLSFTDATSAAIMQTLNIKEIATFDKDFSKLGLNVINS
jgi:predicted nucleic acid-binding protein